MQKLAELCVRRPVFATMLILGLTVVGLFGLSTLGMDRFPNVDLPTITVTTTNRGASPQEIEREISDRIEASVNTVSGIEELRSTSVEGRSQVIIIFALGKNVDVAAQEVRQKVDLVLNDLPRVADAPVVQKINSDATAVLMYAIRSPKPLVELTETVDKQIVERLESVSGVGNIEMFGGRKREVGIRVDPTRLRAYNLTVADVARAVRAQNLDLPGGSVDEATQRLTIRTLGKLERAEAFNDLVIANRGGHAIKIRDVGSAEGLGAEPQSVALQNGDTAVVLSIRKQSGANTVAVIDAVNARLTEIRPTLPRDVHIDLVRDQSLFIRASLNAINEHLVLGGLLAGVVVYLFLRNWRSTVIAALAIPTSIIASFAFLAAVGYTLNLMTMLALTMMVGIVIDDAIVVLENIYRFIEEKKMTPFEAAIEGTREIGLAVMATTMSLLAVFVPLGFMGGVVGRFFSSFGLTSAAAIAVSLLVSFTLTPALAARFLKAPAGPQHDKAAPRTRTGGVYGAVERRYMRLLEWSMSHRGWVVGVCVLVFVSIVPLGMLAGFSFIPEDDENEFEVVVRAPEGTSLAATQSVMEDMARMLRQQLPGVIATLTVPGYNEQQLPNAGTVFVRLSPAAQRSEGQTQLIGHARQLLQSYPRDYRVSVQAISAIANGERNAVVQVVIGGPDLGKLEEYSSRILDRMRQNPNIVDADRSLVPGKPELRVTIDRARAADLGVQVEDIATTINTLYAGQEVGTISRGKDQYDIRVWAIGETRRDRNAILTTTVPSATGQPVELRNVVSLEAQSGPGSIDRLNRDRQVTLYANVPSGGSQSDALNSIRTYIAELGMEPGFQQAVTGNAKELERSGYYFMLSIVLTFVFMYIVLAALFESFIHPVTILLTLPLAVPFALLSTAVAGQKMNIFSMLGILVLFGVVKKNAILQIDHTSELRAQGMKRYDAILLANRNRLRPILMTTIALVAGMVPLLVGSGPGSAINRSIGVLVVGGQSFCLLLTLLAVPVFYSLFEDLKELPIWQRLGAWFKRRRRTTEAGPALG